MGDGWIKLHRQLRESSFYTNSVAKAVWLECLLRASHVEREVYLKREKIRLGVGQFVVGRDDMAAAIGEKPSTVWFWLLRFEADNMLDIKKTTKGSIASVKNWHTYQGVDSEVDNGRTTDGQRIDTNKKVKNERKKETKPFAAVAAPANETSTATNDSSSVEPRPLQEHLRALALFVLVTRRKFRTSAEVSECVKRFARISKDISVYPVRTIAGAYVLAEEHWKEKRDYHLTLETVGKYIQDAEQPGALEPHAKLVDHIVERFELKKNILLLPSPTPHDGPVAVAA